MFPIPFRVPEVDEGSNWYEEIKRELEDLKIWSAHGSVGIGIVSGPRIRKIRNFRPMLGYDFRYQQRRD